MEPRVLGRTGLAVSPIGLGLAALGRPGYINLGHAADLPGAYELSRMEAHAHAVLDAAWPPEHGAVPSISGAYRLKLVGGVWKIDGISCQAGDVYNWSAH